MLTPEYLEALPQPLVRLMEQVEEDILQDVARRIGTMALFDPVSQSTEYQLWRYQQTSALRKEVVKRLAKASGKTEEQVRKLLQRAGYDTLADDDAAYREMGLQPTPANKSPALLNLLNAGYRQTVGSWRNLTATTANTVTKQFEDALDRAWAQVSTGAFDYKTAIKRAVDGLAKEMKFIEYPSGHKDTLEVAVRRAVLTGVNQTAAKLQLERMDEMAEQGFGNFVQVSAHAGARSDGSGGPADHAAWQGKVYHRGGRIFHEGEWYEDFEPSTGFGTGEGLCGWNCRHNFHPFWPGLSVRNYTAEQLEALNAANVEYNGQMYTRYQISQMQRALERKVRSAKRKYLAEAAAGVDATRSAVKLKAARQQLSEFIRATGGRADSSRTGVAGFGRSEAGKANWAARKELEKYAAVRYNQDGTIVVTDDWKAKGKVRIPSFYKPNAVVETLSTFRNGKIQIDRSLYTKDGWLKEQVHSGDHNKPHSHRFGPEGNEPFHKHIFHRTKDGIVRDTKAFSLTDEEKIQHRDILWEVRL